MHQGLEDLLVFAITKSLGVMHEWFLMFDSVFQVLELDSSNVKALYRRAQAYIQLADLDLAEFDIKKALEIDPDNRYFLLLFVF